MNKHQFHALIYLGLAILLKDSDLTFSIVLSILYLIMFIYNLIKSYNKE